MKQVKQSWTNSFTHGSQYLLRKKRTLRLLRICSRLNGNGFAKMDTLKRAPHLGLLDLHKDMSYLLHYSCLKHIKSQNYVLLNCEFGLFFADFLFKIWRLV